VRSERELWMSVEERGKGSGRGHASWDGVVSVVGMIGGYYLLLVMAWPASLDDLSGTV
jgi:hypothetical protein